MKKIILVLICNMLVSTVVIAQKRSIADANLETHIIALDKAGWEAWKNKDVSWFRTNTTEDFLSISSEGISNKTDVLQSVPVDCDIKSYSLDNFKFVKLNAHTVTIIYNAVQDGTCNGTKIPAKVRATVTYVKRGDKWLEAVYMETAITQ